MKNNKYYHLSPFFNGLAGVYKNTDKDERFGFINKQGEEVIECDFLGGLLSSRYAQVVDVDGGMRVLDRQGNELFKYSYSDLVAPTHDLSYVNSILHLSKMFFHSNLVAYMTNNPFDDEWTIINPMEGNKVMDITFADVSDESNNGLISVMDFSEKWGAINEDGDWAVPALYDSLEILQYSDEFSSDYFNAAINGKYGLVSRTGEVALKFIYDDISYVTDQCIIVKTGRKYGVITFAGETIIPCKYDRIKANMSENTISVKSRGLWGWTDMDGNILVKPSFYTGKKYPPIFRDGLARVYNRNKNNNKNEGNVGFVNKYGEMAIPYKFNHPVASFSEGRAAFFKSSKNRKKGWIDQAGDIVIPPIYTTAEMYFREGCTPVSYNKEWFYIDRNGTRCLF